MPRTDASSTLARVAPTDGGRTTCPCTMPGTRTVCTYSSCAVTIAGMSSRGTDVPSSFQSAGRFRRAAVSSVSMNFRPPTRSP